MILSNWLLVLFLQDVKNKMFILFYFRKKVSFTLCYLNYLDHLPFMLNSVAYHAPAGKKQGGKEHRLAPVETVLVQTAMSRLSHIHK